MPKGGARIGAGRKPKHRARAQFTAGVAAPPSWLSPAAKAYYRRYGQQLEAAGVITHADRDTLAMYAALLADIAALSRQIHAKGFQRTLVSEVGEKTNPLVTQYQQSIGRVRMLAQDLGLTPASRGRVQVVAPPAVNPEQAARDQFFSRPTLVKGGA